MNPVVDKVAKAIRAELESAWTLDLGLGDGSLIVDGDVYPVDLALAAIEALGLTEMVNSMPVSPR